MAPKALFGRRLFEVIARDRGAVGVWFGCCDGVTGRGDQRCDILGVAQEVRQHGTIAAG